MRVTFDPKMTFEKHLRSVSRAASQKLGILMKSWRVFHDSSLLWRLFRGLFLPVLEYCSAVLCSAAYRHLKLLDRTVSGVRFLTGVCLSVTLLIVVLWQYCVCCMRSEAFPKPHFRLTPGNTVLLSFFFRVSYCDQCYSPLPYSDRDTILV